MVTENRWQPAADRYAAMEYRRCGRSGLKLPAISLGLWHNFGHDTPHQTKRDICRTAFDLGITHFDLANNYGPLRAAPRRPSERSCAMISPVIATS